MITFPRARVPAISEGQWAKLAEIFATAGKVLEPAQLRSATGVKSTAALSLIIGMFEAQHADLYLLVFHDCAEHPVHKRRYEDGFQPVPWKCLECGSVITDPDDLRYEIQAILRRPVEFV